MAERIKNAHLEAENGGRYVDPEKYESLLIREAKLSAVNEQIEDRIVEMSNLQKARNDQAAGWDRERKNVPNFLDGLDARLNRWSETMSQMTETMRGLNGDLRSMVNAPASDAKEAKSTT